MEVSCRRWYQLFGLWTKRSWLKLRHRGEPELGLTNQLTPGILEATEFNVITREDSRVIWALLEGI